MGLVSEFNVGWTEIFTVTSDGVRIIVDNALAKKENINIKLETRHDPRGYYHSIPGSALLYLPMKNINLANSIFQKVTPARFKAIELAAHRRVGRGVRAGHNQWAAKSLSSELLLPELSPNYIQRINNIADYSSVEGTIKRIYSSRYERNQKN